VTETDIPSRESELRARVLATCLNWSGGPSNIGYLTLGHLSDSPTVLLLGSAPGTTSTLIGQTIVCLRGEEEGTPSRKTTSAEELIADLRAYRFLSANWDGEGGAKPIGASIEAAVSFAYSLVDGVPAPEPMLHASGNAGLFWNSRELYADIEFSGHGRLSYYIEVPGRESHRGGVSYERGALPSFLVAVFGSAFRSSTELGRSGAREDHAPGDLQRR